MRYCYWWELSIQRSKQIQIRILAGYNLLQRGDGGGAGDPGGDGPHHPCLRGRGSGLQQRWRRVRLSLRLPLPAHRHHLPNNQGWLVSADFIFEFWFGLVWMSLVGCG